MRDGCTEIGLVDDLLNVYVGECCANGLDHSAKVLTTSHSMP